jgi:hypothetical protein
MEGTWTRKGTTSHGKMRGAIAQAPHKTLLENVNPSLSALKYFEELQIAQNHFSLRTEMGHITTGKE